MIRNENYDNDTPPGTELRRCMLKMTYRSAARALVPAAIKVPARQVYAQLERAWHVGSSAECPCCGATYRRFLPYGQPPQHIRCGRCGSLERHRLLCLYLRNETTLFTDRLRLLHVAPEPSFRRIFASLPHIAYVTMDYAQPADIRMDITNLAIADRAFDAIICMHVLEHIPDDRQAMSELYRILKPRGWAILQVPIDPRRERTYEDVRITSPEERLAHFGQEDHVRVYGRDYRARLESAGFDVTVDDYVERLPAADVRRYGLPPHEDIYMCRKP